MANLESLRELYAWMREVNILYARCGELELRLEPKPPAPSTTPDEPQPTAEEIERRNLEDLLHSSGVDPASLQRMLAGRAA